MNTTRFIGGVPAAVVAALFLPLLALGEASAGKTKAPKALKPLSADDNRVPTFEIAEVTTKPKMEKGSSFYSVNMRRQGMQGEALLDFVIDEKGNTRNIVVVSASTREFGAAAASALAECKYIPGKKDDRIVRTHLQLPLSFRLRAE
jgi:TonB family protein